MHDVFISFSFDDQKIAEDIVNRLSNHYGISCWICTREVNGGDEYKEEIVNAIEEAQVVVVVHSKHAADSKEIPKEIGIAFDDGKKIIPFLVDSHKMRGSLKYDLQGKDWIDATKPTFEERVADLAASIRKTIQPLKADVSESAPLLQSTGLGCSTVFHGREDIFNLISAGFAQRNTVFLQGMGGIGKSEIALQYAQKHNQDFSSIVFARYDSSLAELIADDQVFCVRGCTRKTNADNTQQSNEEYAHDKLQVLRQADEHTLIIIDNFDVQSDPLLEELTAPDKKYRVLITSRYLPERGKYTVVPVKEMDDETLKDMIIDYASGYSMIDRNDPSFPALFAWSARHTLTLELIAKFMAENSIDDIDEILEILHNNQLAVTTDSTEDISAVYSRIRNLFHLTKLNDIEKDFLRNLALMPVEGVDQRLFKQWCGNVFKARNRLADRGLIHINGNGQVALHPIVREVVIAELKPDYPSCKAFVDECAMMGKSYTALMWLLSYEKKKEHLDCYKSIMSFINEITPETFQLYFNMATMQNYIGSYRETIALLERMLTFAQSHYGDSSDEALNTLEMIAWKHSNSNDFEKAIKMNIIIADHYIRHPNYLSKQAHVSIQRCGELFLSLYEKTKNEDYLRSAHKYLEESVSYGKIMLQTAKEQQNSQWYHHDYQVRSVCRVYIKLHIAKQEYGIAAEYLQQWEQLLADYQSYPDIAVDADRGGLNRYYGLFFYLQKEYDKAIEHLLVADVIYRKYFSTNNLRILQPLEILLLCYQAKKDYAKAREYYLRMFEIAQPQLSDDHPICLQLQEYDRQLKALGY